MQSRFRCRASHVVCGHSPVIQHALARAVARCRADGRQAPSVPLHAGPVCAAALCARDAHLLRSNAPFAHVPFGQCQAIHARSLLPCQDTPGAKFTYTAELRVPAELTALMSALSKPMVTPGVFEFEQPVPIPSCVQSNLASCRVLMQACAHSPRSPDCMRCCSRAPAQAEPRARPSQPVSLSMIGAAEAWPAGRSYLVAIAIGELAPKQIGPRSKAPRPTPAPGPTPASVCVFRASHLRRLSVFRCGLSQRFSTPPHGSLPKPSPSSARPSSTVPRAAAT